MSAGDWCLIESDPGVFTELIRGFGRCISRAGSLFHDPPSLPPGVQGVQVDELWSLEQELFQKLQYVMCDSMSCVTVLIVMCSGRCAWQGEGRCRRGVCPLPCSVYICEGVGEGVGDVRVA